jgi:hypothetical protein
MLHCNLLPFVGTKWQNTLHNFIEMFQLCPVESWATASMASGATTT